MDQLVYIYKYACNYDPSIQIASFVKELKSSDSEYSLSVDPLQWNLSRGDSNFASIKQLAHIVLCSPSSVERLFGICSRIHTSDRARMSPEALMMMISLKAE